MKTGYDIGQFERSGEISLHFWNLADLGVKIDYSESEHWYGSKNGFQNTNRNSDSLPPAFHTRKKTPVRGNKFDFLRVARAGH